MGASSDLYQLNHDVMTDCVAPAIFRLLETGQPGPWLQCFWDQRYPPAGRCPFFRLPEQRPDSVMTYLDHDLSEIYGASPTDGFPRWPSNQWGDGYDLQSFVADVLSRYCHRDYWHFGNARTLHLQWDGYNEFVVHNHPATGRLDILIDLLSARGRHWMHSGGGFSEGIHGWLRPDETAELARLMADLPLPQCEPTWEALKNWKRHHSWSDEVALYEGAYYAVYLVYLRTTTAIAARSGRGVLYGNDIYPHFPERKMDARWLAWRDGLLLRMARSIREDRAFRDMPILADALEEAGCDQADMIVHCREGMPHRKTCWVLDLLEEGSAPCRDMFGIPFASPAGES